MSTSRSPLPALEVAAATVGFDEVQVGAGAVWWLESRPRENGRVVLMRLAGKAAEEFSLPGADVGSDLHGYGGRAWAVDRDRVFYVDRADGDIHVLDRGGARTLLRRRDEGEHFGDLAAADGRLWCVRETDMGDELLEVLPDGTRSSLARDDGFLGSPSPFADGLAWLRWDADRMPWDGSELLTATRHDDALGPVQRIAGGRGESITQPWWDERGRLWFASDRTGWWNPYRRDAGSVVNVAPISVDVAPPEWEAGYRSFVPLADDAIVMIGHDGPQHHLLSMSQDGVRPIETPFTSFKPYLASQGNRLYAIAASPTLPPSVVRVDLSGAFAAENMAAGSAAEPIGEVTAPEVLRCPTAQGGEVTAQIYRPWNAARDWCAPLVVRAHPGPTSSVTMRLDWHVQYLTSHGFAVADVDYRGSSGYGRAFRRSLYGQWGTADVEDCTAVAVHLLEAGRARAGQVFITGASAGGYTALQAISHASPFAGAVARSAIVSPHRWQQTAPRWQRPHAAALTGPAGDVQADHIQRPVLLIHGSDDHIAPLADARELTAALAARGMPHQLLIVDARHALSAQHAAAQALEAELAFYRQHLPT